MMKLICVVRQIPRRGDEAYSWRLPLFDDYAWSEDVRTGVVSSNIARLLFVDECTDTGDQWMQMSKRVLCETSKWNLAGTPFSPGELKRLLAHGPEKWLNDEIVNGYLELCRCLRPDVRFLGSGWFEATKEAKIRHVSLVYSYRSAHIDAERSFKQILPTCIKRG
jgi:hypothetical protein